MRRRLAVPLVLAMLAVADQAGLPVAPAQWVAAAEARPRSSGGYSRSPSTSRSYSAPSSSRSSGGYSSGGYSRPSAGSTRRPSTSDSYGSGDRSYNRSQSGDALRRMRESGAARQRATEAPRPPVGGGTGYGTGYSTGTGRSGYGGGYSGGGYSGGGYSGGGYGGGWYRNRGWTPPGGMLGGPRSFGIWDAAFLWFLFSTLSSPGHADFFHNHQADPGYQQWRQEAEKRAAGDAEIRGRLDQLDRSLAERQGQPQNPDYLPPDVPVEVATGRAAADARTPSTAAEPESSAGGSVLVLVLVVVGGGLAFGWLAWRRRARTAASTGGSKPMGPRGPLQDAAAMLRHKLSGGGYAPSQFRLGMPLTIDPTPFILAAGHTQVRPPPSGSGALSVDAVGRIGSGPGSLVRLYLPEEQGMVQLHLGPANQPDECRFFTLIDEVTPADEAEWQAWLHPAEGMLGWPEFQTKDGKVYQRAWAPGASRIAPREMLEEVETTAGRRSIRNQSMLYAAPTGAAAPAPATEYILVSAIEDGQDAWVEIRAGLDINPASLSLA